ncbi:serine hydrolase domain-containing protein [Dermacoccaceae bacterium W4C1]
MTTHDTDTKGTQMNPDFAGQADALLQATVENGPGVPGVVAGLTDREQTSYLSAAGRRSVDDPTPLGVDDIFALFSTTKAITSTVALQLWESGQLDLDAPAQQYAPAIGELQVITGFDDDGNPQYRPPASQVTTRQLLTHSGGFGYDFFNEKYARLASEHGQPSVTTASRAALMTPLLFDPGTQWEYGSNLDWVGQVIEGITGRRLGEVMATEVFQPLGMDSMTFALDDARRANLAQIHARGADDSLTPMGLELPSPPEVDFGGHGLYGTVEDYLKFIRMWLNDGQGPNGRVLKAETVAEAVGRHLAADLSVTALPGVIPSLSNDAEFFPGVDKSWSLAFMRNEEEAPTGRPAGGQGWAGLANLFYWVDRENGFGGFWATQILPFGDPASFGGYLEFESTAYRNLKG